MPRLDPDKIMDRLIRWAWQDDWERRRIQVFADHLAPMAKAYDLRNHEVLSLIGDDGPPLIAFIMEEFLTTGFGDTGETAVGSYLGRRGWREDIQDKRYLQALDASTAMLYEVRDRGPDGAIAVRNLLLGGPPVTVAASELTGSMERGSCFAGRLLDVGGELRLTRGTLPYSHDMAKAVLTTLAKTASLDVGRTGQEAARSAEENIEELVLRAFSFAQETSRTLSGYWMTIYLGVILPDLPLRRNSDGEKMRFSDVGFPLRADAAEVAAALDQIEALVKSTTGGEDWMWRKPDPSKEQRPKDAGENTDLEPSPSLRDSIIGIVSLESDALVLSTDSKERAKRGRDLLASRLGRLVGKPRTKHRDPDQAIRRSPRQLSSSRESGRDDRPESPQARGEKSIWDRLFFGRMRRVIGRTGWFSDG